MHNWLRDEGIYVFVIRLHFVIKRVHRFLAHPENPLGKRDGECQILMAQYHTCVRSVIMLCFVFCFMDTHAQSRGSHIDYLQQLR